VPPALIKVLVALVKMLFFNDDGSCVACTTNCDVCSDAVNCDTCASGFGGTACGETCPPNCNVCSDAVTCTTCASSAFVIDTDTNLCIDAPEEPDDDSAVMYMNAFLAVLFAVFAY